MQSHLEAGKLYAWCACGLSQKQPFCDGSHKPTTITAGEVGSQEDRQAYLCGCKQSLNKPFCDGTHGKI